MLNSIDRFMPQNSPNTCLVVVTHNRLRYTKLCLESVLADRSSEFELFVWDNGSTDGTGEYLSSLVDPRLRDVILSPRNEGQTRAMNEAWARSKAPYVAKLDNDCLVTEGWLRVLTEAHRDVEKLGAVACWHYRREDFDDAGAAPKIAEQSGHKIFRHPWVCGSGFVMKRATYEEMGPWPEGSCNIGTTDYFWRMAMSGYINGWYVPLVLQHHMDDPFSPYCSYYDDESLRAIRDITFTLRNFRISTMEERLRRRVRVLEQLNYGSYDPRSYCGVRDRVRRWLPSLDRMVLRLRRWRHRRQAQAIAPAKS